LLQVRRWLPKRKIVVVADSSFAALDLIGAVRRHVCFITRLRLDAGLYQPAPPRPRGQKGRPAKKGRRLPKLADLLKDKKMRWTKLAMPHWYGDDARCILEIVTGTAVWHRPGSEPAPIRWVLVRDPTGLRDPQAFLCADLTIAPATFLCWFVSRWSMDIDQAWRLSRLCCRLCCGSGGAAGGSRRQAAPGRRGRADFLQRGERLGIHAHEQDAVRGVLHAAAG